MGLATDGAEKNVFDNPEVNVVKKDNPDPKNIEVIELEESDLKTPEENDAEAATQSSHGTSPPKGDNEKDPEVNPILDYDLETFTLKFLENRSSVVDTFLSQLSTPSYSHSPAVENIWYPNCQW